MGRETPSYGDDLEGKFHRIEETMEQSLEKISHKYHHLKSVHSRSGSTATTLLQREKQLNAYANEMLLKMNALTGQKNDFSIKFKEQISKFANEIDSMSKRLTCLDKEFILQNTQNHQNQKALSTLRTAIHQQELESSNQDHKIQALERQLLVLEQADTDPVSPLQTHCTSLVTKIRTLNTKIATVASNTEMKSEKLSSLRLSSSKIKSKIEQILPFVKQQKQIRGVKRQKFEQALQNVTKARTGFTQSIRSFKDQKKQILFRAQRLSHSLHNILMELDDTLSLSSRLKIKVSQQRAEMKEIENDFAQIQTKRMEMSRQLSKTRNQRTQNEKRFAYIHLTETNLSRDLAQTKQNLFQESQKLIKLREDLVVCEKIAPDYIETLQKFEKAKKSEVVLMKLAPKEPDNFDSEIRRMKAELDTKIQLLEAELGDTQRCIPDLQRTLKTAERRKSAQTQDFESITNEIRSSIQSDQSKEVFEINQKQRNEQILEKTNQIKQLEAKIVEEQNHLQSRKDLIDSENGKTSIMNLKDLIGISEEQRLGIISLLDFLRVTRDEQQIWRGLDQDSDLRTLLRQSEVRIDSLFTDLDQYYLEP